MIATWFWIVNLGYLYFLSYSSLRSVLRALPCVTLLHCQTSTDINFFVKTAYLDAPRI